MDYEIFVNNLNREHFSNSLPASFSDFKPFAFGSLGQSSSNSISFDHEIDSFNRNESFFKSDSELKEYSIDNDDFIFFNEINTTDGKAESEMDTIAGHSNCYMTEHVRMNDKGETYPLWQFLLGKIFELNY